MAKIEDVSVSARRVFVMDDSPFALELTQTALAEAGIEVTTGRDLADLSRLDNARFDLVLMDVEMPEAYGDDIAGWLRTQGHSSPVYLISSLPREELAARAEQCGVHGYIEKALGIDAVVAKVMDLLGVAAIGPTVAPTLLAATFHSGASGRVRRAEGAIARGDAHAAAAELHTLAGEASLLGVPTVAAAAAAARHAALAASAESQLTLALAVGPTLVALDEALTAAAGTARVERPAHVPGPADSRSMRILLLDDSELYRSALMSMLEDSGFEVVEARRLSEARHRMHDGVYAVAVLDLQLEDGHGSDLIPELRQHARGTRLILLSADEIVASEADVVLSKSLDPDELVRRIAEIARS
jgi:DNA-binding response OmpR family regulator